MSRIRNRKSSRWAFAAGLLALLVGGAFLVSAQNFHPYVVFQTPESVEAIFIHSSQPTGRQCDAVVDRVVEAMTALCSDCRLKEGAASRNSTHDNARY